MNMLDDGNSDWIRNNALGCKSLVIQAEHQKYSPEFTTRGFVVTV